MAHKESLKSALKNKRPFNFDEKQSEDGFVTPPSKKKKFDYPPILFNQG